MGQVINLRRARKRKLRQLEEETAAANRIRHGAPKRDRTAVKAETTRRQKELDGRRLDPDKPD